MSGLDGKRPEESRVILSQLMGPGTANNLGYVHGGHIMRLADEAGGMAASKHSRRPCVTVAVDSMTFHSPVNLGDLVTVTAEVTWTGRTSLETRVVVRAEDVFSDTITHTNTAYIVYVALGPNGRPAAVPPLRCETDEERQRMERAAERQALRLSREE